MKVIILGAGEVGRSMARGLLHEGNEVTLVDQDPDLLAGLGDKLEARKVCGHAAYPSVLLQAGIEDADLVLAVTNSDETNMIACQVAHTLFHTPTRLARVRGASYLANPHLFKPESIPIDLVISPEELVTAAIEQLIEHPGALQIIELGGGCACLVATRVDEGSRLIGEAAAGLPARLAHLGAHVVAIYRDLELLGPDQATRLARGDELFLLSPGGRLRPLFKALGLGGKPSRRVTIAGGGNIGLRLARRVERTHRVKVIDPDPERCRHLASTLHRTIVLRGDGADPVLLSEEDIARTDVFCAVTNDEEINILSGMVAMRLGAKRVISIINRPGYVNLAQGKAVDIAISPAHVTIGALLAHTRRGDVVSVHTLRRGTAELLEIIAHGDPDTSRVVGCRIGRIDLPAGVAVAGIIRVGELLPPDPDFSIQAKDRVIVFIADKRNLGAVEDLFRVAVTFL